MNITLWGLLGLFSRLFIIGCKFGVWGEGWVLRRYVGVVRLFRDEVLGSECLD